MPSGCRIETYGVLQSSRGVAGDLASASGDEEAPPLVTEVTEERVSASEWYVVGHAVLIPGERGAEETTALLAADLPVPGRTTGIPALAAGLQIDLRRMALFEVASDVGSALFVVFWVEKQRSCRRDRSIVGYALSNDGRID